jgi:hypothetical protein
MVEVGGLRIHKAFIADLLHCERDKTRDGAGIM